MKQVSLVPSITTSMSASAGASDPASGSAPCKNFLLVFRTFSELREEVYAYIDKTALSRRAPCGAWSGKSKLQTAKRLCKTARINCRF
jgi:hypothetical protein